MLGTQNQRELHLLRELTAGALRNMKGSKRKQKMAKRFINQMKENNLQHPQRQLPTYDSQRISGNLAEQSSAGGLSNQNQLHMLPSYSPASSGPTRSSGFGSLDHQMLNIPANEQDIIARQSNDSGQFGTSGVIQRSNQSDGRDQFETPGPRGYPGRGGGSARVSHFGSPSLNRSLAVSFETPLRGPEAQVYDQSQAWRVPRRRYSEGQAQNFYQGQEHSRGQTPRSLQHWVEGEGRSPGHTSTIDSQGQMYGFPRGAQEIGRSRSYNRGATTYRRGRDFSRGQSSYSQPPFFRRLEADSDLAQGQFGSQKDHTGAQDQSEGQPRS
ncbi:uncharacterized protein LOC142356001 isoform X2 [Convolutriloba macropyga]|uniref:uncharacterized protein LOC142356001 isoform X2 n=1 Tax=Convolutriloba macropyga TaxID=536237 RepID=UPI003F527F5C